MVLLALPTSVAAPAATGLVRRLSGAKEQGTMLGAAQAMSALGRLTGPLVIGRVYDGLGARPAFFASAAVMGLAWLAATRVTRDTGHPATLPEPALEP